MKLEDVMFSKELREEFRKLIEKHRDLYQTEQSDYTRGALTILRILEFEVCGIGTKHE